MSAEGIEAILFDMGGTLREPFRKNRNLDSIKKAVGDILGIIGLDADVDYYTELILSNYYRYRKWAAESMEELREEDIWTKWILPEFPRDRLIPYAVRINEIFKRSLGESPLRQEAAGVIKNLYSRGYKLGIVSNTFSSISTPKLLEEEGLKRYFDVMVLSSVHGKRKPDPSMIIDALDVLKVKPERAAFVGDRLERDVLAAKKARIGIAILLVDSLENSAQNDKNQFSDGNSKPDVVINNLKELLDIFG